MSAGALVSLSAVERLSPRVIRILGGNPSKFTLQGTNTYLVGQGTRRLLIDTGQGKPVWVASLKDVLANESATVSHALLTHWHEDHVGGVADLVELCPDVIVHKHIPSLGQVPIIAGQTFSTQGASLRALHCPGHTDDHVAFILEEEDAMFTGDNVLGQGTAVFEKLGLYMDSLRLMAEEFNGRAYPGHGPVLEDGRAAVVGYLQHREERERQILAALRDLDRGEWTDASSIVDKVYPEVEDQALRWAAGRGVEQVLEKLQDEGTVEEDSIAKTWRLMSSPRGKM